MYSDEEVRESESFVIGGLMVKPGLVEYVIELLGTQPTVFSTQETQAIYSAVVSLYEKNEHINALTIWVEMEDLGLTDKIMGGAKYLRDLYAQIVETESTMSYARVVKGADAERQAQHRATRIAAAPSVDEAILEEASRIEADRVVDTEPEPENQVPFPESLLVGVFDDYVQAYHECTEVSPSLLFGTLKTLIGSTLGRRVSLEGTTPLFPNFYSVVVGHTGLARKSTALYCGELLLQAADPGVFILRSVATPEGLIAALVPPPGFEHGSSVRMTEDENNDLLLMLGDSLGTMLDNSMKGKEGFRICLSIDEFSHVLKKAGKTHGDGLIQLLATAYNFPPYLHLPTRVSPLVADHPCVYLTGATTLQWLESSLKLEDIQGGFANRITYYLGNDSDPIFLDKPGKEHLLDRVRECISMMRVRYPQNVRFRFDDETRVDGQKWYESHRKTLSKEVNPLVVLASARTDVHVKKAALLFSALGNDPDDHYIHQRAFDWAVVLAEYLQAVVQNIYSNFNFSDVRRLESRITELVTRFPNITGREITQRISWASAKDVNAACHELVENGTLGEESTKWTVRFYVRRSA